MTILKLKTPDEVRAWCMRHAASGKRVALVPTMGFLHDGHLSLMREGLTRCDVVAASIFVNPSQFGPHEDLARYPRDLTGDLSKCESAGVSAVYVPEPSTVYPEHFQTWVNVEQVSQGLCGDRRPGHFRGVATVVTKLLALFRPDVALFGEKDYQQLQVIRRLNVDLDLGVEIVGMPTIREVDGLAMSSRNSYLAPDERQRALAISRGLFEARAHVERGERNVEKLIAGIRSHLQAADLREDYVEIRHADTFAPLATVTDPRLARVLVAVFSGKTRLIDNMALSPVDLPKATG